MLCNVISRLLFCLLVFIGICDFSTTTGFAFSSNDTVTLERIRRQTKKCDGFKCATTEECIEYDKRCDGAVDCKDGSDEFNDCKEHVTCPGYAFACDYGGCVDGDKKCNGKKDCRDNSDEANCVITENTEKIGSNCKSDQFECKSGQCIHVDDKCNGTPDCKDQSDETKETCLNMYCPGFTFKCDYGACVDGYAECNGIKDCLDNSDEQDCGVTPTPVVTPKPEPGPSTPGICQLQEHPANGKWSIAGGVQAYAGERLPANSIIEYSCNEGYKLSSESKFVICTKNGWSVPQMPTCMKLCPPLYTTEVTNINCYYKNVEIKCDEAIHNTSAEFKCATYFEPADRIIRRRFCYDGTWNLPPPTCQPVCGEKKVSAEPLIVNGQKVQKGDYPWSTAIFQKVGQGFLNVCGGSILTQRVILTAAHCVTNDYGNALAKENFKVGVGKYYNKYKDPRDSQAQYSDLDSIIVNENYKADSQRYASDIALLITKDVLLLSKVVQPVCYNDVPNLNIDTGSVGVVTGWGFTLSNSNASEELRELEVPFKPRSICEQEISREWLDKYFTYDKMCTGHYNQSKSVCKGDSGGGLVFKSSKDNRFYVHGIVSVSKQIFTGGCDIQVSALYTSVAKHYDWLDARVSLYNKL